MRRKPPPSWDIYCYKCTCIRCNDRDVYVGSAKWGTLDRHKSHTRVAQKLINGEKIQAQAFDHFMAKHGIDHLEIRTLGSFSSSEEMFDAEIRLIIEHKTSTEFGGLNVHPGGKGGTIAPASTMTCSNISAGLKALHARNPEFRKHSLRGRQKWAAQPGNASQRAKHAWETKRKRQAEDPEYAAKQHALAVERGKRGREAQLRQAEVQSDVEATCKGTTSQSQQSDSTNS